MKLSYNSKELILCYRWCNSGTSQAFAYVTAMNSAQIWLQKEALSDIRKTVVYKKHKMHISDESRLRVLIKSYESEVSVQWSAKTMVFTL